LWSRESLSRGESSDRRQLKVFLLRLFAPHAAAQPETENKDGEEQDAEGGAVAMAGTKTRRMPAAIPAPG